MNNLQDLIKQAEAAAQQKLNDAIELENAVNILKKHLGEDKAIPQITIPVSQVFIPVKETSIVEEAVNKTLETIAAKQILEVASNDTEPLIKPVRKLITQKESPTLWSEVSRIAVMSYMIGEVFSPSDFYIKAQIVCKENNLTSLKKTSAINALYKLCQEGAVENIEHFKYRRVKDIQIYRTGNRCKEEVTVKGIMYQKIHEYKLDQAFYKDEAFKKDIIDRCTVHNKKNSH